jgi:hypothetical protein
MYVVLWILSVFLLVVYSFTQVDLGLTLTTASFWQSIQQAFQYVGYFQRPLSTTFFLGVIILLTISYLFILRKALRNNLSEKMMWRMCILTGVLAGAAYSAFSYDIFNYIFDARIITDYGQNPYLKRALDFPMDPMLSFMHWTHRTYPYGPLWLVVTVPFTAILSGWFLGMFYAMKLIAIGSYILLAWGLYRLMRQLDRRHAVFAVCMVMFSPLVVIELLVSGHNDALMLALAVGGISLLTEGKRIAGILLVLASTLVKQATVFLLPVTLLYGLMQWNGQLRWKGIGSHMSAERIFGILCCVAMSTAVLLVSMRADFQPWYLVWVLVFVPLAVESRVIACAIIVGLSGFGLLRYVPYLYHGDWTSLPLLTWLPVMATTGLVSAAISWYLFRRLT